MEEKEVKYLSLDDCKKLVYSETKMIALQFMGTFNNIDVVSEILHRSLCVLQPIIVGAIGIYGKLTNRNMIYYCILTMLIITPMLFLLPAIVYFVRKKKQEEMDTAKAAVAIGYFSKTKEFTQEDWVRDKIFENEIEPYIQ